MADVNEPDDGATADLAEAIAGAETAIQAALAAYEAALLTWREREAEVAAGLAEVPWELSHEEFMKEEAFGVARLIIHERHPASEAASNRGTYTYRQEIARLRVAISVVEESLPSWRDMGTPQDAAEPDLTELESQ